MNVLFVSQCTKRALTETRRILDQFAERRGERTWQTSITQAGLDTVRKLLRQTARKNTAVACHWIRGRDHSELLWVVGDGRQFNAEGAVPTNTSSHDILRRADETTWHHLPLITALSALAALLHDLGKATQAFQDRLRKPNMRERSHYRHEWVSVRLLQAFVGGEDDAGWLQRLAACAEDEQDAQSFEAQWLQGLHCDGITDARWTAAQKRAANPFASLPPLAQAVAWLVLTHHRLPCLPNRQGNDVNDAEHDAERRIFRPFGSKPANVANAQLQDLLAQVDADWNEPRETVTQAARAQYWRFPHGLPVSQLAWRKQAARYARKLQALALHYGTQPVLHDPFTMHLSRMCLMLADHHYSSITDEARRKPYRNKDYPLFANTAKSHSYERLIDKAYKPIFNQTLDEHLLGVQAHACTITHALPSLARSLPALQNHKGLKKRNQNTRFQWQDKAADLAASVRLSAASQGAFIVNMASTGCGKTLGNARIMNALADPALGMRCAFAIGLRTLTMQTGRSFQRDLGLSDEQLAIQVGGAASRELFEYWEQQAEATGSASSQALLDEGGQVLYEGDDRHPLLERLTDDANARRLIAAPLLVCTVDHLIPATESLRGGRQIAPMLRLLTSDLVLDEPDDFDMADLPALTRLVHWAGLLGCRVLLSSATLPPALVQGLFLAYCAGRAVFQQHRSERPHEAVNVCCLWVDEFQQTAVVCADQKQFADAHTKFVQKRVAQLTKADIRRQARIVPLPAQWYGMEKNVCRTAFAQFALESAWKLHQDAQNHSVDPSSGKQVSFGLIRMANIDPLYAVALAMYAQGAPAPNVRIHLCVYHSQFPLLARSLIEQHLDTILNRRGADHGADPALQHPSIRALIDSHPEQHQLFIVLGSPVTEVGRDHDYDWAVVEPSSMRSLIQLAGRVRRHRSAAVGGVNVALLDSNLKHFERHGSHQAAFCKPGFEMDRHDDGGSDASRSFSFDAHSLQKLLSRQLKEWAQDAWPVDARPRIARTEKDLKPRRNWVDLEHARMRDAMLPRDPESSTTTALQRAAYACWHAVPDAVPYSVTLTGVLPQYQRFREDPQRRVDVVFLPDEDEEKLLLHRVDDSPLHRESLYVRVQDSMVHAVPDTQLRPTPTLSVQPWMQLNLMDALRDLAQDLTLEQCAKRYATVSLPDTQQGWCWHPVLGFSKAESR